MEMVRRWFMLGTAGFRSHRVSPIWLAAIVVAGLAGCSGTAFSPGDIPDLVVTALSVNDSRPAAGATFTLSATVQNAGGESSEPTTLRFYRSTDTTITTSDTAVGRVPVAGLAASGTSSQLVILTPPTTPGTYYYGACVDAVAGESDPSNNCSSSVRVDVVTSAERNLLPGAPTSFRHECGPPPGCTTVSYLWSPPSRGLPVLRYEFHDISGLWFNEAGDWPVLTDQQGDVELLAFYASVTNGTFTVRVRAVNEHGTGPEASLTFTLPPEQYQEQVAPTQVTNLGANCIRSCDRVGLSWDPPGTGRPITRYEVWATDHPEWQSATTDEFGNPDDSFRYNDDVWDEGTYEYKVRASNPHGTGPEASVSIERNR